MAEMYLAWDPAILNRADDHGCLDENVETGDPIVCGLCLTAPNLPSPDTAADRSET